MSIIKLIHSSFSTAEEALVKEARRIINTKPDNANFLKSIGFVNAKNVRDATPEAIKNAAKLLELQEKYRVIAPNYRFITEDKRIELCKKYGIVMAGIHRFTGLIPERNIQDLMNFKISDPSYLEKSKFVEEDDMDDDIMLWRPNNRTLIRFDNMDDNYLHNVIPFAFIRGRGAPLGAVIELWKRFPEEFPQGKDTEFLQMGGVNIPIDMKAVLAYINPDKPVFFIISDIAQLNTEDAVVDQKTMFLSHDLWVEENRIRLLEEEDPIILVAVLGGWLIVTFWGLDYISPDIVNPVAN